MVNRVAALEKLKERLNYYQEKGVIGGYLLEHHGSMITGFVEVPPENWTLDALCQVYDQMIEVEDEYGVVIDLRMTRLDYKNSDGK